MIGLNGQHMATRFAARFEYIATITGLHTLTETVNALAATNFRLISTLGRHSFSASLNYGEHNKSQVYTTGMQWSTQRLHGVTQVKYN